MSLSSEMVCSAATYMRTMLERKGVSCVQELRVGVDQDTQTMSFSLSLSGSVFFHFLLHL